MTENTNTVPLFQNKIKLYKLTRVCVMLLNAIHGGLHVMQGFVNKKCLPVNVS